MDSKSKKENYSSIPLRLFIYLITSASQTTKLSIAT